MVTTSFFPWKKTKLPTKFSTVCGSRLQRFGVKLVTLASERARVAANQVSSTVFFCIVSFVAIACKGLPGCTRNRAQDLQIVDCFRNLVEH